MRALWRLKSLFVCLCFTLFSVTAALAPYDAWAQTHRAERLNVEGNRRIEADAILERMQVRAGQPFGPADLSRDIREIFRLGYFEDVKMLLEGSTLKVQVRERPVIRRVLFEGSDEFSSTELEKQVSLRPFHVLSIAKVLEAQRQIAEQYEQKGYYLARVDHELVAVGSDGAEVDVLLRITENEQVRVRRVYFLGNKVATSADLKQNMATAEGHVFSWATGGGTYRETFFERDLAMLAFYYANEGYINAEIAKPRVTLSHDRRYVDIFIDVQEGEQHFLGELRFQGRDLLFSSDELTESFEMQEGDVFSAGRLQERILALTDKYGDEGYAFANVVPMTSIRPGSRNVDLAIEIEKGEQVYWGRIEIAGNDKTYDKVIRRELRFSEGDLYNATARKRSLARIQRTGFFENVNFLTSSPEGTTNVLDLEVQLTEKLTGSLNVAAGYGSGSGFLFSASVSQHNLFGRGQQLSFSLQLNARSSQEFSLRFTDPKAFDTEWLMGFDLYYNSRRVPEVGNFTYKQMLRGINLRIGREIFEDFNLYGTYKLEGYELREAISPEIFTDPEKDQKGIISSVAATLEYDTRNDRLDPSSGWYWSASAEFAGLGGRPFQKYLGTVRYYRTLFWKLVYRSNYQVGLLANSLSNESVPDSERFTLGGIYPSPLRGFPGGTVGPVRQVSNVRDNRPEEVLNFVIGGTHRILINQELEFPLIPEADIRAAVFFDSGNAWSGGGLGAAGSPALLSSYGWGIRWYSPLGPLRFEWGYPLSLTDFKRTKGAEFHFIIAPTF